MDLYRLLKLSQWGVGVVGVPVFVGVVPLVEKAGLIAQTVHHRVGSQRFDHLHGPAGLFRRSVVALRLQLGQFFGTQRSLGTARTGIVGAEQNAVIIQRHTVVRLYRHAPPARPAVLHAGRGGPQRCADHPAVGVAAVRNAHHAGQRH